MAKTDSISTDAKDLVDLVVGYAKQETLDPVKKLGKTILWGILGAVVTGLGSIFLMLAVVRFLQTETESFNANLSFLPYVIGMVVLLVGAAVAWKGVGPSGEKGGEG